MTGLTRSPSALLFLSSWRHQEKQPHESLPLWGGEKLFILKRVLFLSLCLLQLHQCWNMFCAVFSSRKTKAEVYYAFIDWVKIEHTEYNDLFLGLLNFIKIGMYRSISSAKLEYFDFPSELWKSTKNILKRMTIWQSSVSPRSLGPSVVMKNRL